MKISIIVSTFNRPDTLQKVLRGLEAQTRRADEVIAADDGSGPPTARLIESLQQDVSFPLIHVWQPDQGFQLARIRNKAILRSTADYIVMMDEDCIPNRHFVRDHIELARPGYFFQGKRVLVGPQLSRHFDHSAANSFRQLLSAGLKGKIKNSHHIIRMPWLPALSSRRMSGTRGCNMAFFREDLLAVNGFNEKFVGWGREDQEIVARLYRFGIKRRNHPFLAICYHLWHPENPRKTLAANDCLLKETLASRGYFTPYGMVKTSRPSTLL